MDTKTHLDNIIQNISVKNKTDNVKPNRFVDKMENFMDNAVVNMYARKWSRLEIKLKKNKINEFLDLKCTEHHISDSDKEIILNILISKLMQNKLNKMNEILYDETKQQIKQIKKLNFSNNSYEFL